MRFRPKFGSHLPVLFKLLQVTDGDVVEFGGGWCSTPVLHWLCVPYRRKLVTYENDPSFYNMLHEYKHEYHDLIFVEDWDKIEIEKPWDIALIDHGPAERRKYEVMRLANCAKYIVIHDTLWKEEKHYQYRPVLSQFKWRYNYMEVRPRTSVVSNLVDLTGFQV